MELKVFHIVFPDIPHIHTAMDVDNVVFSSGWLKRICNLAQFVGHSFMIEMSIRCWY